MATPYQDNQQPQAENAGVGLVAGLVLVLAVIALVFLAARAAPGDANGTINIPNNAGESAQLQPMVT